MSERKVIPLRPGTAYEANIELAELVDQAFETAKAYRDAGDKNMAQAIERHAHGLRALLIMRRR